LKRRCLKWARMNPFEHLKHKLWAKERLGIKLAIWPDFLACKRRATCRWKALEEDHNFVVDLILIQGLHVKLWGPEVIGDPIVGISKLPLGSPGIKFHLDVGLVEKHIVYYKGEGDGFPQVRAVVSLVSSGCPWLVLTRKVVQLCTNHFVLVLCRPMWVSEAYQFFLVPSRSSKTPFYPSKVLQAKECALIPCSSIIFYLGFTFESFKELGHTLVAVLIVSMGIIIKN